MDHPENLIDLRVAASTNVNYLATSIVRNLEEGKTVTLSCVGVQPISQAAKAVAIAVGKVASGGLTLVMVPSFIMAQMTSRNDTSLLEEKTLIRFAVYRITVIDLVRMRTS